jgi:hypothetical protein
MEKVWRVVNVIYDPDNIRTNRRRDAITVMIIFYEFSVVVITCMSGQQRSGDRVRGKPIAQ